MCLLQQRHKHRSEARQVCCPLRSFSESKYKKQVNGEFPIPAVHKFLVNSGYILKPVV
jgi:hypothetical protein